MYDITAKHNRFRVLLILGSIWLAGAVVDRIWFALDRSVPGWDEAQYLTGSLNYWRALQHPQLFNGEWWQGFWLLSSKIPPLTYITAAIAQNLFGLGRDQATLVQLLFSAVLLGSVYGLGRQLFSVEVGLWAAGLCQLLPGLYHYKLTFLLDYPLTALVMLSFCCLTVWRDFETAESQRKVRAEAPSVRASDLALPQALALPKEARNFVRERAQRGWLWAAGFGVAFGLALMVKQTAVLFLLTPIVWVGVVEIRRRRWGLILQLIGGLCLSVLVFGPWYRTNWLIVLTASKRATIDSAIAKGDPALNTLSAWTFYWRVLPYQVSWLLLLVPIVGLLLYWKRLARLRALGWLAGFCLGGYVLSCLNINKDERYVMPYLPVVAIVLAYGLTRWGYRVRWGTAGLAVLLVFLNLFPGAGVLGYGITQALSPNAQHYVYLGPVWPHSQVIDEVIQQAPYLRSTLGVLPSTGDVNQHNFNYYGALQNFQVYGRQVGTRQKDVSQDARSLDWFLTKSGDQGSVPKAAQATMVQTVASSLDFQIDKTWNLPDRSILNLYHRRMPSIQVRKKAGGAGYTPEVKLERVIVPAKSPPGVPVPVTYEWSGSWKQLQSGLVLLTWQNSQHRWLHDHGIAMGGMQSRTPVVKSENRFQVIEQTAMLPPANTPAGVYTLVATYINRQTGAKHPILVPPVQLVIDPESTPVASAPELDLVTQLRVLAASLPEGLKALGPIFEEIGRINQYDPIQDYVAQAQMALAYRLQMEPQNLDWAYGLALSTVLRRQVNEAIATLERVTHLDAQNPSAYTYLAFVNLYDWRPVAAQVALKNAVTITPNSPEIHALSGIAALMQGNLIQAWQQVQLYQSLTRKT
ncbi:MAG: glycosyltransferase family 39 protein [Chroococcidiopsidaceae cyanobacterium CP_BM_RX_35]|nr:glycosyltransferase family 39 protein [Chroococcidiopsidaceae cyanobacterium CP_BM_RX_35]